MVSLFSIDQVIKREPRQAVKAVIEVAEVQVLELVKIEVAPTKITRKGKKVKIAKTEVAQA
jgi:hypothetical protein